jgi:flavin-dependent dehydrogenase
MRTPRAEPPIDLAVLGAGPAGAACALAAARAGLEVAVFEPRSDAGDKPCGEGLLPDGVEVLRQLGLGALVDRGRPFAALHYCFGDSEQLDVPMRRPGLALERPLLQAALDRALASEPRVRLVRERAEIERADGSRSVRSDSVRVDARAIAIATGVGGAGAAPAFRGPRDPAPGLSSRFGLRARFAERDSRGLDSVEVHLGDDSGCEIYLTPLPERRVNAAVLFHRAPEGVRGASTLLEWALARHPRAESCLGELLTAPRGQTLALQRPTRLAEEAVFLVGDAGGSVDPILGCGLTIALRSGIHAALAAEQLADGASAPEVERLYTRRYREEAHARRRLAGALVHLSTRPRFARAAAALLRRTPLALELLVRVAERGTLRAAQPAP